MPTVHDCGQHRHTTEAAAFACIRRRQYLNAYKNHGGPPRRTAFIPPVTRRAVLKAAQGRCEGCGKRRRLELHHLDYANVGSELPEDLRPLCRRCHHSKHIDRYGRFWADPTAMFWHWHEAKK